MNKKYQKIIVLGIDGATWKLFDLLMKQGRMKSFNKLIKKGVRGNLKSTVLSSKVIRTQI